MKVFRNILCWIYIGTTLCSLMFISQIWEFPLAVGAGSWIYALVIIMVYAEQRAVAIFALLWFVAFWVLLLISAILAYKDKFTVLCVFCAADTLITIAFAILPVLQSSGVLWQSFLRDGVPSVLITAVMITAAVLCRKKEMRTDVDEFLRELRLARKRAK